MGSIIRTGITVPAGIVICRSFGGSGAFRGDSLRSKRAEIDISGSGSAVVAVAEKLDVDVSGSGSVSYIGDPQVKKNISGSGSVRKQ